LVADVDFSFFFGVRVVLLYFIRSFSVRTPDVLLLVPSSSLFSPVFVVSFLMITRIRPIRYFFLSLYRPPVFFSSLRLHSEIPFATTLYLSCTAFRGPAPSEVNLSSHLTLLSRPPCT